jgi:TonB family protein
MKRREFLPSGSQRMNVRSTVLSIAYVLTASLAISAMDSSDGSDVLTQAKALYQAASYDEALALLDGLPPGKAGGNPAEVEEYRLYCLLALDRKDDAVKAAVAIVSANPEYQLSETHASPRVLTVFRETRRAILPAIVNRTFNDAKAAFARKDPAASEEFERVLLLLEDPDLQDDPATAHLKTVVNGFRDLSRASATPTPPAASVGAATPNSLPAIPATRRDEGITPGSASAGNAELVSPVALSRPLPTWPPAIGLQELSGVLEVTVDRDGNVTTARIQQRFHPFYDPELLKIAKTWKFKPATIDGVPTEGTKVFHIRISPPQ